MNSAPRVPGTVAEVLGSPEGDHIAAFFDLDGTLVAGYTVTIYTKAGLRNRDIGVLDFLRMVGLGLSYQAGAAPFESLVQQASSVFRGRTLDELHALGEKVFGDQVADLLYPETRALVRAHRERGHRVVLCSSATSMQVQPVADYLGIDEVVCNQFVVDADGTLTGGLVEPVIWGEGKATAAQRYAASAGVDLADCYFYADGDEDVALMHLVGKPRPTNPGPLMAKVAKKRGWPISRYSTRGIDGRESLVRNLIGASLLAPITAGAAVVGAITGSKRSGLNVVTGLWPRALLEAQGVKLNVVGAHNLDAHRPAIFIFNHRTAMDTFIVSAVVRTDFTGVAKHELKSNPLFGTFGRAMDIAFIDRENTDAAVSSMQDVERVLAKGISVVVSPEGHRYDTHEVGAFKKGAFRMAMSAGVPVVPIVIGNADDVAARDSMTVNPGTVNIAVLQPISVSQWPEEELVERIDGVRDLYLDVLSNWPAEGDPRV
ncbi:MAG: HAD-IB family hydrolase [Actinobacteria bacterium]|nr:HAD-IB family hydrolase [Actinomycetota bacterium]